MHHTAQHVRTTLHLAYKIVLTAESLEDINPGPRLSQIQFGQYLARTDPHTARSIAADILADLPPVSRAQLHDSITNLIRSHWNTPPQQPKHNPLSTSAIDIAYQLTSNVAKLQSKEQIHILRLGSILKTWTQLAKHFPKRDPYSLRDDYNLIAKTFYSNNEKIICDFSRIGVTLSKIKELR